MYGTSIKNIYYGPVHLLRGHYKMMYGAAYDNSRITTQRENVWASVKSMKTELLREVGTEASCA